MFIHTLGQILYSVILPVFIIIGVGWLLDRKFQLDLPTLSKLNFYVFVPALMFVMLGMVMVSAFKPNKEPEKLPAGRSS